MLTLCQEEEEEKEEGGYGNNYILYTYTFSLEK